MDASEKQANEKQTEEAKRFERRPNFDTRIKLSRDGKYWIVEHVQTVIFPRKYLDVIAQNHVPESSGAKVSGIQGEPKTKGRRNDNRDGQRN